jgi:hypothetical protein
MCAATAAVCIVPLGVAKPPIGLSLTLIAFVTLLWSSVRGQRVALARRRTRRVLAGMPGAR